MAEGNGYHSPSRRVCAVCGRVLDELGDEGLWFHGLASADEPDVVDHPAIPVRDDEVPEGHIRARCDFCFADDPPFVLPARSFRTAVGNSDGDWAACGNCARHLQRNDWKGLLRRAMTGYEARHHERLAPGVADHMRSMYRQLRKNITGPIYRLGER